MARRRQCAICGTGKEPRNYTDRSTKTDFPTSSRSTFGSTFRARESSPTGEVEVVRHPGAPVGQRTDILVNTLRRSETGEPIDPIAAVIETKGCWNDELFTAPEPNWSRTIWCSCGPVGIYLVGWFDPAKWDPADSRRDRVPKETVESVRWQLEAAGGSGAARVSRARGHHRYCGALKR